MADESSENPVSEAVVAVEVNQAEDEGSAVAVEATEITTTAEVDDVSMIEDHTEPVGDDDEMTIKSQATDDDAGSTTSSRRTPTKEKSSPRRNSIGGSSKRSRPPSVAGLEIPFRTVKKAMKLDPEVPIVQTEAALMVTVAAELFVKSLAAESFKNAKARGKNVIQYADVAEGRTKKNSLAFLQTLLP